MQKIVFIRVGLAVCWYLRRNQRICYTILHNIAIKLATGEVTVACDFDENLEKLKF